jgi:hypothetical protein
LLYIGPRGLNDLAVDLRSAGGIGVDQCPVAQLINQSRHTVGRFENRRAGIGRKNVVGRNAGRRELGPNELNCFFATE